jgi:two-component system OmpR family response regulator
MREHSDQNTKSKRQKEGDQMTAQKVLVIDDEVGFTKLLKMNLEKGGEFEVRVENNSMKALSAAREFHPDVVLLDVVMPGLDGGDVAALFQEDPMLRKVPIIMLTALVSPGETSSDAVAQSGSMSVLPKPVNLDKLVACLREAIGA